MSITLVSRYRSLRVVVEPTQTMLDPQRGPVVVSSPVLIRFQNGVAEVSDEVFDKVKDTPSYTGDGGEKLFWRADDVEAPVASGGDAVGIRSGMQVGHAAPLKNEPLDGWDSMTVKEIQQALAAGRISDAGSAIEYESRSGGRRRSTVIKALASMLDARTEGAEAPAPSDTFSAPAPAEGKKD